MCILVTTDDYLCDHKVKRSHGIPEEFIRDCEDSDNLRDCELIPCDEAVPWLCPDCHWSYVQEILAPLWQHVTITKCRVLQTAEMFPPDAVYLPSQNAADGLKSAFDGLQASVNQSAEAFHNVRDATLRSYLGNNFATCLRRAHERHRPWSLCYIRDPFHRTSANLDDMEAGGVAEGSRPPPELGQNQASTDRRHGGNRLASTDDNLGRIVPAHQSSQSSGGVSLGAYSQSSGGVSLGNHSRSHGGGAIANYSPSLRGVPLGYSSQSSGGVPLEHSSQYLEDTFPGSPDGASEVSEGDGIT